MKEHLLDFEYVKGSDRVDTEGWFPLPVGCKSMYSSYKGLIGVAPIMKELYRRMELLKDAPDTLLITGETGSGKELVARVLHSMGKRCAGPFVPVNVANLPPLLFDSEMFGCVKGAYSGADAERLGLARVAEGGVLFIDEIEDLTLENQGKLLRFLETREVRPVGSTRLYKVDVRVLCAANRDLKKSTREGRFRSDLYYRIKGVNLHVPPVRQRKEDIPLLVDHFLQIFKQRYGKRIEGIAPKVWKILMRHSWPGNVREIRNEVERMVLLTPPGAMVTPRVLSDELHHEYRKEGPTPGDALKLYMRDCETRYIRQVLRHTRGNVSRAALLLGISRVSLTKKMKRYGLQRLALKERGES